MDVQFATDQDRWDQFLSQQRFRPFLQSWTMGEVYRTIGEEPIRLEVRSGKSTVGLCQAIVVPARRGRHLALLYGPVLTEPEALEPLLQALSDQAKQHNCHFLRVSPFWPTEAPLTPLITNRPRTKPSPLHLISEHTWYLPLTQQDPWQDEQAKKPPTEESLLMNARKTTRNLIRRAGREGVTVEASTDPLSDLDHFFTLYDETRKRHGFVPYPNSFIRSQVEHFAPRNECTLYLAWYQGEVLASSVHMHVWGETSYHHGASTHAHPKIPASYLLQWTAIQDALKRGDHVYNFWGIAPEGAKNHPFSGVTTFKRGFGGKLLELAHCQDIPLDWRYYATRVFEQYRRIKRGF